VAEILKQKRIPYSYVCSPKVSLFFMDPAAEKKLRPALLPYWPLFHLPSTEFQHLLTQQQVGEHRNCSQIDATHPAILAVVFCFALALIACWLQREGCTHITL
jgi:hypothetical protein